MSLLSLITSNTMTKELLKEVVPVKNEFKTISGREAFSKSYINRVPYTLRNVQHSRIVGIAFDYVARWTIAKSIRCGLKEAYEDTCAEHGIEKCRMFFSKKQVDQIETRFIEAKHICESYVGSVCVDVRRIVEVAVFFAKLEQVYRSNKVPESCDYLFWCEEEIVADVINLYDVFVETFLTPKIVRENSVVIFNPCFGNASRMCGGADADIYIDGVLYDFKTTKNNGYTWTEVAQIIGYYLLDYIAKKENDFSNDLIEQPIIRVAFYKARYGEIEYYDVSEFQTEIIAERLVECLESYPQMGYSYRPPRKEDEVIFYGILKHIGVLGSHYLEKYTNDCFDNADKIRFIKRIKSDYYSKRLKHEIDVNKINQRIAEKGISIEEISVYCGKNITTVKKWLNGTSKPTLVPFLQLVQLLQCQDTEILIVKK